MRTIIIILILAAGLAIGTKVINNVGAIADERHATIERAISE